VQIVTEWSEIARWSQWTAYRKPPPVFYSETSANILELTQERGNHYYNERILSNDVIF